MPNNTPASRQELNEAIRRLNRAWNAQMNNYMREQRLFTRSMHNDRQTRIDINRATNENRLLLNNANNEARFRLNEASNLNRLQMNEASNLNRLQINEANNQARSEAAMSKQLEGYLSMAIPDTTTGKIAQAASNALFFSGFPQLAAGAALLGILTNAGDPIDSYNEWRRNQELHGTYPAWNATDEEWKNYVDIFPSTQEPPMDGGDAEAILDSREGRLDNLISFASASLREAEIRYLSNTLVTSMRG